jgi:hypothetical protein
VSSRTARAIQRNPVSKNQKKKKRIETNLAAEGDQVSKNNPHKIYLGCDDAHL